MFGALNRFISVLDAEPSQEQRPPAESTSFGFQVLRNKDAELPLEPWFDFIVGLNGHPVVSGLVAFYIGDKKMKLTDLQEDPDPNLFATEVRNCAGSSVTLEIWSAKVCRIYTSGGYDMDWKRY